MLPAALSAQAGQLGKGLCVPPRPMCGVCRLALFFYQQAGKEVPTGERGKISVLVQLRLPHNNVLEELVLLQRLEI